MSGSILISEIIVPEDRQRRVFKNLDKLADSMRRLGQQKNIVLDRNNVLVSGERRYRAIKSLGWTHIEFKYTDETDPLQLLLMELEENTQRQYLTWQEQHDAIIKY